MWFTESTDLGIRLESFGGIIEEAEFDVFHESGRLRTWIMDESDDRVEVK